MRHAILIFLASCSAARAGGVPEECGVFSIDKMPAIEFPRRVIEVSTRSLTSGDVCYTNYDDYIDYADCCPDGWHPLALGVNNGVLCEED